MVQKKLLPALGRGALAAAEQGILYQRNKSGSLVLNFISCLEVSSQKSHYWGKNWCEC